jgi:hypothetical protein
MESTYLWGSLMGLGLYALAYLFTRAIMGPGRGEMVTSRRGIFLVLGLGSALLLLSLVYMIYYFPAPFVDDTFL